MNDPSAISTVVLRADDIPPDYGPLDRAADGRTPPIWDFAKTFEPPPTMSEKLLTLTAPQQTSTREPRPVRGPYRRRRQRSSEAKVQPQTRLGQRHVEGHQPFSWAPKSDGRWEAVGMMVRR